MITRSAVIAEARSWVGTRWHHQARVKGVGVDCAGVIIGVARALGISDFDTTAYARQPDPEQLLGHCAAHLDAITQVELLAGDILVLAFDRHPQHFALLTEPLPAARIVHAYAEVRRCIEQDLGPLWMERLRRCYRFRGVTD